MSTVTTAPVARQAVSAMFTFEGGPVISEGERIRACGMDEIESRFGEDALAEVMRSAGKWVPLAPFDAVGEVRRAS